MATETPTPPLPSPSSGRPPQAQPDGSTTEGRRQAVDDAANLSPEALAKEHNTKSAATDWFLSTDVEVVAEKPIELNVATVGEQWVPFVIQVVDRDRIDEIRKEATRMMRDGSEEVDAMESNLRVCVEGLKDPDLSKPEMRIVRGQRYLDPADALKARFAHKPGLIDQLAGEITRLSGYNAGDVREVKAAKN